MLEDVLRDALFELVRFGAVSLKRNGYMEARDRLAVELMRHANAGELSPKTLGRMMIRRGLQASIRLVGHAELDHLEARV